jgi:hypothetical protein
LPAGIAREQSLKLIKKGESYGSGKMETKLGIHSNEILQGIRRAGAKDIGLGLVVCIRLVEAHGGRT